MPKTESLSPEPCSASAGQIETHPMRSRRALSEPASQKIGVLLLIDSDSSPVRALIESIPLVQVCQPTTVDGVLDQQPACNVAIMDLTIARQSVELIEQWQKLCPALPVIVLADRDHEDSALELLRCGVSDYLLIEHLDLDSVTRALRYALSLSRLQRRVHDLNRHLEVANHRLRELFLPASEQIIRRPFSGVTAGLSIHSRPDR